MELKPALFDSNIWYQVSEDRVDNITDTSWTSALQVQDAANGICVVWPADKKSRWQFVQVDKDTHKSRFSLRVSTIGPSQQLATCLVPNEADDSRTQPCLRRSSSDPAQKWDISSWDDGTLRFVNAKNGSNYVMDVHRGNPIYMSSAVDTDTKQEQIAQHWMARSVGVINDEAYSTTVTNPSSSSTHASSTAINNKSSQSSTSTTSSSSSSNGLSSGALAGIGIAAAIIAIGLAVAAFLLLKRHSQRRRHQAGALPYHTSGPRDELEYKEVGASPGGSMLADDSIKGNPVNVAYYSQSPHPQELDGSQGPIELPSAQHQAYRQ